MGRAQAIINFIRYKLHSKNAHGIHSPFVFSLYNNVITETESFYALNNLAKIRRQLRMNDLELQVEDFGAGSKVFKGTRRKVSDIARHGIAPEKYARLLFRLVNFSSPETIVELGTSIGLTTMYLAAAAENSKVYTIEGSPEIAGFAKQLISLSGYKNVSVIEGRFEDKLPELLDKIERLDFAYVDGNHKKQPTLDYFEQLLTRCHADSLIVFDDINWSEEMQEAWGLIKMHPKVKLTIDLHFIGIVFFRSEQHEKEHFILKY